MAISLDDLFGELARQPIQVEPPGGKPVWLRWPTFAEWHSLGVAHRSLNGGDPPAALIAQTIATCLCDKTGKRRLSDDEASLLLEADGSQVMWLYVTCWQTVLRNDDQAVEAAAKN